MGLGQRAGTLNRRANDSFGDTGPLVLLGILLVSMGALVALLTATLDWYWRTFGWVGVLYAILLSWILLGAGLITYRDLFHPSWLPRAKGLVLRPRLEPVISTSEPRRDLEQAIAALRNDFSVLRDEVIPKIRALDESLIPVVHAHAKMILLLTDRDRFSSALAEFEKYSQAIKGSFQGRIQAIPNTGRMDTAFSQARDALARLIKEDFGEDVDLWPDLKTGESPLAAAPNDGAITDQARKREYRDFHRRYNAASRLIQEFKERYNSEMGRVTEIVSEYARERR